MPPTDSYAVWFAQAVSDLSGEARRLQLQVPAYRVDRTGPTLRRGDQARVTIPRHPRMTPGQERRLALAKLVEGTLLVNGLQPGTGAWGRAWAALVAAVADDIMEDTRG